MREAHRIFAVAFAAGLVVLVGACSANDIDDAGSPNVVLTISNFPPIPPVTTANEGGFCIFTVPAATAVTLKNQPKSSLAGVSPFNDVVIDSAIVSYVWDDDLTLADVEQSTSGTIPAGGTGSVSFTPILLGNLDGSRAGHSASLMVQFWGRTVDGTRIASLPAFPGGAVLSVNSCPP